MGLINWLKRNAFLPVCRNYSRSRVGNRPADALLERMVALHFWHVHRYWPRLRAPRSFEEKINARMLFDRDPRWILISDKLRSRDFVSERVGEEILIPLIWSGERAEDLPFKDLPNRCVIKANHGCGYNIIVSDKSKLDEREVKRRLGRWLAENHCWDRFMGTEWAYSGIKPMGMVEAHIGVNGQVPPDYKFMCFDGRVEYVQMNFDRFADAYEKFFDREFRPLDLWQGTRQFPDPVPRPGNYDEMVRLSEALSRGFDFLRVDLYNVQGRIYFGELTCYPSAGSTPFVPESFDFEWGGKWKFAAKIP